MSREIVKSRRNGGGDNIIVSEIHGIPWEISGFHEEWKRYDPIFIGNSKILVDRKRSRRELNDFQCLANLVQLNNVIKTKYNTGIEMFEKNFKLNDEYNKKRKNEESTKSSKKKSTKKKILSFNPEWVEKGESHFSEKLQDENFLKKFQSKKQFNKKSSKLFSFFKKLSLDGLKKDWSFGGIKGNYKMNNNKIEYETTTYVESSGTVKIRNIFSKNIRSGDYLVVAVVIHGDEPYLKSVTGRTIGEALSKIPPSYVYYGHNVDGDDELNVKKVFLETGLRQNIWVLGRFGNINENDVHANMLLTKKNYENVFEMGDVYKKRDQFPILEFIINHADIY